MKIKTLLTLSVAGILAATSMARANSIEITGFTVTPISGGFDYQYTMSLTAGNAISATNPNGTSMFVFYDVNALFGTKASFTAGTTPSNAWNVVFENTTANWTNANGGTSIITSQGAGAVISDSDQLTNVR